MPEVFIGYRRDDGGFARALYEYLLNWFDSEKVFLDHEGLDPGDTFKPALETAIDESKVFLAVIGPQWLSEKNRPRLQRDEDITRGEIRTALINTVLKKTAVIPILCGGAQMPPEADLPADIVSLRDHHALMMPDSEYASAQRKLLVLLKERGLEPRFRNRHTSHQYFHVIGSKLSRFFTDPADKLSLLYSTLHDPMQLPLISITTVDGMGGVGKTQLTLKYSHAFRDEYAGIWWFRAEDLTLLQQDYETLLECCGIERLVGEETRGAVVRWLQQQPPWLLVYDNAETAYGDGEALQTLTPFLPSEGNHHIIITSRSNQWEALARQVTLDVWTEEQAHAYLSKRLVKESEDKLRQLARALGGLPLALDQACAYILKNMLSVDAYCSALDDWEKRQRLLGRNDSLTGYTCSVLATLSLAFDKLTEGAKQLLRQLGWFASEPIPQMIFRWLGETVNKGKLQPDYQIDKAEPRLHEIAPLIPETLLAVVTDELNLHEAMGELTGYALMQVVELTPDDGVEEATEQGILLHRLVQEAIRANLSAPDRDSQVVADILYAVFPTETNNPLSWALCKILVPHVQALQGPFERKFLDNRRYAYLLDAVSEYLVLATTFYGEAARLSEQAVDIASKTYGNEDAVTLKCIGNLAKAFAAFGNFPKARCLQEKLLEVRLSTRGEHYPGTIIAMINLSEILLKEGSFQRARVVIEKALKISCEVNGERHDDTVCIMGQLARVLRELGYLRQAAELQERVAELRLTELGANDRASLVALNNLAGTYGALGKLADAREMYESTLKISTELLGEEHTETVNVMANLSSILSKQGMYSNALTLDEKVLEIHKRLLGEEHIDTLISMDSLAGAKMRLGDLSGALVLRDRACEIASRVLGDEHPTMLHLFHNLAASLKAVGQLARARALEEAVLEVRRRRLGEEHPKTLNTMCSLAGTLDEQGHIAEARELQGKVLTIRRRVLGKEHSDTSVSAFNLFQMLVSSKAHQEASQLFHSDLEWLLKIDAATLGAHQRAIRKHLSENHQAKHWPPSQSHHASSKKKKRKR